MAVKKMQIFRLIFKSGSQSNFSLGDVCFCSLLPKFKLERDFSLSETTRNYGAKNVPSYYI